MVAENESTLVQSSYPGTSGASVTIGETMTFAQQITLPETTSPNLIVTQLLPPGMIYVNSSVVTAAAPSNGILAANFPGNVPVPTILGGVTDGDDVVFTFGSISNPADGVTNNDKFLILVTVRVTNVVGNVNAAILATSAAFDISGDGISTFTSPPVNVTVVEPNLVVTESITEASALPRDRVTFVVSVNNNGTSPSNDTTLTVPLAAADFDISSVQLGASGTGYPADFAATTNTVANRLEYTAGTIDAGITRTFTFTALVKNPHAPGSITSTVAVAQSTTLPGANANERSKIYSGTTDTLTINNPVPTDITLSNDIVAENIAANSTVGTLTATDDAGDTHTFSLVTGTGDTDNGAFTISGSTLSINASPNFEAKPSYAIRLQVSDGSSGTFAKQFTITVTNVNELPGFTKGANPSHNFTTATAQTIPNWAAAISNGDPDVVQSLTFNVSVTSGSGLFAVAPAINSAGNLTFTPNGTSGAASVSVTLTDDSSINGTAALTTAAQTFTITINLPPVTTADMLGTRSDLAATVVARKFALNDTDPESDALTITAVSPTSAHGTVSLSGGNILYTPTAAYIGSDIFTYTVTDARGATATGTVNVNVTDKNAISQNSSVTETSNGFVLNFAAIPGNTYTIQYTAALASGWQTLSGPVVAPANGTIEYTDNPLPRPPSRFYRLISGTPQPPP